MDYFIVRDIDQTWRDFAETCRDWWIYLVKGAPVLVNIVEYPNERDTLHTGVLYRYPASHSLRQTRDERAGS